MSERMKWWIKFGEYGDQTDAEDYDDGKFTPATKFGNEDFYTYYSRLPREDGVPVIELHDGDVLLSASEVEKIRQELKWAVQDCANGEGYDAVSPLESIQALLDAKSSNEKVEK